MEWIWHGSGDTSWKLLDVMDNFGVVGLQFWDYSVGCLVHIMQNQTTDFSFKLTLNFVANQAKYSLKMSHSNPITPSSNQQQNQFPRPNPH